MTKDEDDSITPPSDGAPGPVNRLYDDNAARAFIDSHAAGALPAVPPEWVPLAELPGWVARHYGVATHVFAGDLVLAVRRRSVLRHRIQISPDRISGRLPPGLDTTHTYPKRTVVVDWEAVEADWATGTIVILRFPNSADNVRLPIDVLWEDVEHYVSLRLPQWTVKPPGASAQTPKISQIAATEVTSAEAGKSQEKPLPPFDAKGARVQLTAKKVGGDWSVAPTEADAKAILLRLYDTVPRASLRKIWHEVWPNIRRGPRPAN